MDAGKLDRRVTLLRATVTRNEFNEEVSEWAPLATRWAGKVDVSDAERMRAQQAGATMTTRFTLRWDRITASVTPRDRLECEGRTYEIRGVKELGRREGIEITTSLDVDAP